jgi:hypothetical protein
MQLALSAVMGEEHLFDLNANPQGVAFASTVKQ